MTDTIQVEGLRFAYSSPSDGKAAPWVLDGLDLCVPEGQRLAVMGASDVGKTTLCLLLSALAPHLTGGKLEGRVMVAGRDTRDSRPPELAGTVGVLFQEPEAQLFNPTVEAEVAWGLENLGLAENEIRSRVDAALAQLHLEGVRQRSPAELSGGEQKRLALASVLAMHPHVLVLDEPMGGLDPQGRSELLATLSALRGDRSTTIVMAESDPEAVAAFAERLAVLENGQAIQDGTPRSLFSQADRCAAMGVAVPQLARLCLALNQRLGTEFSFLTAEEALAALLTFLAGREASREREPMARPAEGGMAGTPLRGLSPRREEGGHACLEMAGVWSWYGEDQPVLQGVNLSIPRGQFVALLGANGSGKTTLVKHFNGLLRPRRGRVLWEGEDTSHRPTGELARHVGFLFQRPEQQIFCPTVLQEVAFGPRNLGLTPEQVKGRVDAALMRFGLAAIADRPPAILSYGVRRRVTLASLAAMAPPVLVLDEPTVGLDAAGLHETFSWLKEMHKGGRTIVLVTHDMALAAEYADRLVVLRQGEIIADGAPAMLFQQPDLLATAGLAPPPLMALAQALQPLGIHNCGLSVDAVCDRIAAFAGGRA
jgi:cobalt transport protein ATP-binding subunit